MKDFNEEVQLIDVPNPGKRVAKTQPKCKNAVHYYLILATVTSPLLQLAM